MCTRYVHRNIYLHLHKDNIYHYHTMTWDITTQSRTTLSYDSIRHHRTFISHSYRHSTTLKNRAKHHHTTTSDTIRQPQQTLSQNYIRQYHTIATNIMTELLNTCSRISVIKQSYKTSLHRYITNPQTVASTIPQRTTTNFVTPLHQILSNIHNKHYHTTIKQRHSISVKITIKPHTISSGDSISHIPTIVSYNNIKHHQTISLGNNFAEPYKTSSHNHIRHHQTATTNIITHQATSHNPIYAHHFIHLYQASPDIRNNSAT